MHAHDPDNRLVELFRNSLVNCGLTRAEYEELLSLTAGGRITDSTNQLLIKQLNQFMANAVIRESED